MAFLTAAAVDARSTLRRAAHRDASPPRGCARPLRTRTSPTMTTSAAQPSRADAGGRPSSSSLKYTYLQGNSSMLQFDGCTILLDPLFSPLHFFHPTFFQARKPLFTERRDGGGKGEDEKAITVESLVPPPDLVLITQKITDHLHLPTLRTFARSTRIVATAKGAAILRDEGFTNVAELTAPHSCTELDDRVHVRAVAGPKLGPPTETPENGYLITLRACGGERVYYEPHAITQAGALDGLRADVMITPFDRTVLGPINYVLVAGGAGGADAAAALRPSRILLINNRTLPSSGVLNAVVRASGSPQEFRRLMRRRGVDADVIDPTPGVPLELAKDAAAAAADKRPQQEED